jgi:hypothetical protein
MSDMQPTHSVSLKLANPRGLSTEMLRVLKNRLNEMAADHARKQEVRSAAA